MRPPRDFNGRPMDLSRASQVASVTDHAVVRYLERVHGFDVDRIRRSILTPTVLQAMEMGATGVRGQGFELVIRDFSVITVLPSNPLAKRSA